MPYDPYALAFPAPAFELSSPDVEAGVLPASAYAVGGDSSPELRWGPLPAGTRSLLVTAFDADAPIPGGWWHWAVKDVPATEGGLAPGAGNADGSLLPPGAVHLANSLGVAGYSGARPPAGTGTHRVFLAVTALDVEQLALPDGAGPALVHAVIVPHTLGRAVLVATAQAPDA